METKSCLREFVKYTSFNVLGMLGISCYILADTFFIAKGLGANGLTALNLAIPIFTVVFGIGLMIGIGGGTKYSIARSQSDRNLANQIFTNTIRLASFFSLIFFISAFFLPGTITKLMGADNTIFDMTKTYIQVILFFAPMFILNHVFVSFVRNDGAPQLAMAAMLTGSFSNILLDYLFIFPLQMGIFGAVLATGLAPVISLMVLIPHFLRQNHHFHWVKCGMILTQTKAICALGLPSLISELSSGIVIVIFNFIFMRLEGNLGVASFGVVANLAIVVIAMFNGIAVGIQPLLSSYYGVGDLAHIKKVLRLALATMTVLSLLIYGLVFCDADSIVKLFNSEHNSTLQTIATIGVKIYFTYCFFAGFNIILSVFFTSTESSSPAQLISLMRGLVVVIPLAFILSTAFGTVGLWITVPLTELLVSAFTLTSYLKYTNSVLDN